VLGESDGRILEICRSGKMTMRRGHHTSRVVKAMVETAASQPEAEEQAAETLEEGAGEFE
jgi:acetolactate synthase-1/3 small subunit